MQGYRSRTAQGFTLIELVIMMVMLSGFAIMGSQYIGFGVDIYSDASERDKALSNSRFVVERLRREVGNALPNSATVSTFGDCLTFTPIIASSIYGDDFPIATYSDSGMIAPIADYSYSQGDQAVVNFTGLTDTDQVKAIASSSTIATDGEIKFSTEINFPTGSAAQRIYIINNDLSYYFSGTNLYRGSQCNDTDGVLMAENITGSFAEISDDELDHSAIRITFMLDFSGQEAAFVQTLQINNVP